MNKTPIHFLLPLALAVTSCAKSQTQTSAAAADNKNAKAKVTAEAPETSNETPSQTVEGVTVLQAVACRSVEDRAPVDAAKSFPNDVRKVYVFTNVQLDGTAETFVNHIWRYQNREMASVKLSVRGPRWRTFSKKTIDPSWKGDWAVDITSPNGTVLRTVTFKIE